MTTPTPTHPLPEIWEVVPGASLGPVNLGATPQAVEKALGPPDPATSLLDIPVLHYPHLRIDLDTEHLISEISLSWSETAPRPHLAGTFLLETPYAELAEIFPEATYAESRHTLHLSGLGLTLWRPILSPEELAALLAAQDHDYHQDDSLDTSYRDGQYWATLTLAYPST